MSTHIDKENLLDFQEFTSQDLLEGDLGKLTPTSNQNTTLNLDENSGALKSSTSFWTFDFYKSFFDIETDEVLLRLKNSLIPLPGQNFLQLHIRPKPDLYGPIWVCVTLVFAITIFGNLKTFINLHNTNKFAWHYDFGKMPLAALFVTLYSWIVPSILFMYLKWKGNPTGVAYSELISLYGYSLAIFIPASVLCLINGSWLQWILLSLAACISGSLVVSTVWSTLSQQSKMVALTSSFSLIICLILFFAGIKHFFY